VKRGEKKKKKDYTGLRESRGGKNEREEPGGIHGRTKLGKTEFIRAVVSTKEKRRRARAQIGIQENNRRQEMEGLIRLFLSLVKHELQGTKGGEKTMKNQKKQSRATPERLKKSYPP